mgnify:CR=1 FL=1
MNGVTKTFVFNENLEYKTKDLFIFAYLIRKISFCITDAVSKTEDPLYDTFLNILVRDQCEAIGCRT